MSVHRGDDCWTYFMGVHPIGRHPPGNRRMFQVLTSQLIDAEASTQAEVIRAFGVPKASVARAVRRYREGGIAAFFGPRRGRRGGTVLTPDVLDEAQRLLNDGCEAAGVAEELGVKPNTLGKALRDGRLREAPPCLLADKSSRSVRDAAAAEGLGTACTRVGERVLAAMGKLHGRRPASSPAWMFRTAGFCAPCRRWWPTGCSPASTGS